MFETLLLFLFLSYLALRAAFDDRDKADRVSAILAVVGVVERADHSLLGDLVELAAPRPVDHEARQAVDRARDARLRS